MSTSWSHLTGIGCISQAELGSRQRWRQSPIGPRRMPPFIFAPSIMLTILTLSLFICRLGWCSVDRSCRADQKLGIEQVWLPRDSKRPSGLPNKLDKLRLMIRGAHCIFGARTVGLILHGRKICVETTFATFWE
jgi:hypothetical protein